MTTRSDVLVDFLQDPRVAEVADPSTEFNMQDIVDTLRKQEDGFTTGLAFKKLVDASGKQELDGGVEVGITIALQNLKIAFEARRTPAESGTVTTGSGTEIQGVLGPEYTFIDLAADFVSANVQPGSFIINFTDRSITDVLRVDSLTTLTTKTLVNGVTDTFQVGDIYQVFNIIQCELLGGNLTAVDDLLVKFSPVLPTAFTQVVRAASSSATAIATAGLTPTQQQIRDAQLLAPTGVAVADSIDEKLDSIPSDVTIAINAALHDGRSFSDILIDVLAMVSGKMLEEPDGSGIVKVYERDNTTVRFTITKAPGSNERTRS